MSGKTGFYSQYNTERSSVWFYEEKLINVIVSKQLSIILHKAIACSLIYKMVEILLNNIKTESIRKLSNYFNFQWTKILYQNNLKNIAFFFTFFLGLKM